MEFFTNIPLMAALSGIVFAQVVKVPIRLIFTKEFIPRLVFSTGGMPSSHTAAVAALTTSIGMIEGFDTTLFAASFIFSVIIMFDASGVRLQAGKHAQLLNELVRDVQYFARGARGWHKKEEYEKRQELKELLGHKPIEVFFGAVTGIIIGIIFANF